MTNINIFLASSLEELAEDREALGNYIRKLNDIYMDRGIYFRLYECEYENVAMSIEKRKQEEYNKKIYDSQLFVVLFYNKAGEYTVEEFDTAYQSFKESGSPAIITCFRQGEGYEPKQSVLDFMKRLDEELGHYFKRYTHIDSLKLSLLMQVKLMNLDIPIELDDSCVKVGGKSVLTLENIPMWSKNADFQHLKKEYATCEQAYLDAKANTTDPATDPVFLKASQKWHDAKEALHQLEQDLFAIALKAEEKSKEGTLTARQRKAYELMEQGDSAGANRILDLHEILDDIAYAESLAEQTDEKLEQHVQELLQKIEILKTQIDNPNRFDEIRSIFEEAAALEERRHLKKAATREYISHLYQQKDYQSAVPLAERYLNYMELEDSREEIADAANILGILYHDTNRMTQAEEEFLRAKEIYEQLAAENPSAYLPNLAGTCNNLGALYHHTNRMPQAKEEYLRAKEIRERLAAENPSAYLPDLAGICNNLGALYHHANRMPQAKEEYLRAKEIQEQLATENPSAYLPGLAGICNNLGNLYRNMNWMPQAKEEYLRAKEIQEQLATENPFAYLPNLASTCNNLGIMYSDTNRMPQAEKEFLRAKEIQEQLATENPSAYLPDLAMICNALGVLYRNTNQMPQAEEEYLRAKEIREQLVAENPSAYLPDLAGICNNLGNLYCNTNRMPQAEEEYLRTKKIYEQLAAENPSAYLPDLAGICNNLGNLYCNTNRMPQAEEEYLRAKEIYEQLAAENPSAYLPYLARTCNNLGALYHHTNRMPQAEEEYLRAKEIYEQLAAENPSAYLPYLARTCNNLGIMYSDTNRMPQAEKEYLRAKEIQERLAAENPSAYLPNLAMSCNNLGILYIDMNKLEDAETMLLQMKQKLVPFATDPTDIFTRCLARSAHLLGQCYANMNCFEEAESEYQQALKLYNGGPDTEKVYSDLKILWSKRKTNEDEKKRQKELNQTAEKELIFLDTDSMSEEAISQAETDMLNRKETLEQSEEKSALAQLADLCYILGRMYDDLDDTAKAEKEYYQALGLYDRLSISCSAFSKRADRVNIDLQVLINLQPDSLGLVDYSEPEGEDMEENDEPDGGFFHRLFSKFKK